MTVTPCLLLPDGRWLDFTGVVTDEPMGNPHEAVTDEMRPTWEMVARLGGHDLNLLITRPREDLPNQTDRLP